jgi:hypothetical protein
MPELTIESVSQEQRVFPPPPAFARNARVPDYATYAAMYGAASTTRKASASR